MTIDIQIFIITGPAGRVQTGKGNDNREAIYASLFVNSEKGGAVSHP